MCPIKPASFDSLQVFCVHGGLFSQDDVKLSQIEEIKRDRCPLSYSIRLPMNDIVRAANPQMKASCVTACGVTHRICLAVLHQSVASRWHLVLM